MWSTAAMNIKGQAMNEAIYNVLILCGYIAFGYLTCFGVDWLWWRYVDWRLGCRNRHAKHERPIASRRQRSFEKAHRLNPSDQPSTDLDSAPAAEFGENFYSLPGEIDVF
jgi:hypothetical protein